MITTNTILYTDQNQKPKKRVYKSFKINYIFTHKFSSLTYSFSKKTNYISCSKLYVIPKRFMLKNSCDIAKNNIVKLGKLAIPQHSCRNMSSFHGGTIKKKLPVTDIDISGKHKIVTETTCKSTECLKINCADTNSQQKCPYRTAEQHQKDMPAESGEAQFETKIVGNTTSKIPAGKQGIVINTQRNYAGKTKPQEMVIEQNPPKINHVDLQVDLKVSTYLQEPKHHEEITNALHN